MAAKKLTEFVKGKISNQNIGSIHFNAGDEQKNQSINFNNYRKLSENKEKSAFNDFELYKDSQMIEVDDYENTTGASSSTSSSPDLKSKFRGQAMDPAKNITSVTENSYFSLNSEIKDNAIPLYTDSELNNMRISRTMDDFDKLDASEDASQFKIMNKSLDSLSENNCSNGNLFLKENDIDNIDFKWFTTSKDEIRKRKSISDKNLELPKLVQKSFIDNYEFPKARANRTRNSNQMMKWKLVLCIIILLIVLYTLSLVAFFGFIFGAAMCYLLLLYYGIIDDISQKDLVSLPKLKDLKSPVIPHIQENNEEDFDIYTSKQSSYSCWINMIGMYDANMYNINQCLVVHLDIEDKILRIRRPKKKIAHRATWKDGTYHGLTFISEILVDIQNVKIDLLPTGLVHKRLWSKKYPICISFPKILGDCISDTSFTDILNYKSQEIYFFGRTCRDKEELFRRLLNACSIESVNFNMWNIVQQYLTRHADVSDSAKLNLLNKSDESATNKLFLNDDLEDTSKKVIYRHNKEDEDDQEPCIEAFKKTDNSIPQIAEYVKYMAKFMPSDMFLLTTKVMHLDIGYVTCSPELLCVNAFLGRIFWDFIRGSYWIDIISKKIQSKLKTIHLPQFMDELTMVSIDLGKEIPLIRKFSRPHLDSRGLWFDMDIAYTGGFSMILETKVNLFNLRNQMKKNQLDEDKRLNESIFNNSLLDENIDRDFKKIRSSSQKKVSIDKTAAFISSEEDSAESSSCSEESGDENKTGSNGPPIAVTGGGSSKRLIRWVDKIARSPYFIKASDNKYIQRGMEMVSNTKIILQVELHSVSGTLAINIPPPPSDRVWYGFRPMPIIKLSAKPKVGQKEISISKITDFIEKKLIIEFQRLLVLPNMDDLSLPLLVNGSINDYISNFQ